ncbi:hypothetical protein RRX38_16390 [Pseudomonas sp. DTU_2021_1001937_2_SI_NGA_ILE_001]|uniref:hypothetical protein n=1 Tax=Pseudomonas sp. DTU_2021_1001937_2_SI_NGA_ILE_001 TaxID=3077589 RepID=UPI0028FC1F58|nr:hypothetical protein [Pseudomonas sp. DTU_2021_1001937_2_SI_NGA_ILE_001]WNW12658.1 hypothetical protein RRX38_16390 [Pseudomonas sp. DTU_2021_1001937_2_SI_NGA_ILE_001]
MSGQRRGQLQLALIFAGFLLPLLIAGSMYRWQFWLPESRTYHGQLLGDGVGRADLGVSARESGWQLLVTTPGACTQSCLHLVYLARQIHLALGRDAGRASHALASGVALDIHALPGYPWLRRYTLDLQRYRQRVPGDDQPRLWIVDPHGNLVLEYDARVKGQDVLRDLRHLLKLSNIG